MNEKNILKIAICDDNPTDRKLIKAYISEYLDQNQLVAKIDEFQCGEEFLDSEINSYSLAVLDIYMDKINGMETARKLIEKNRSLQIIFCSTSTEFAAESYDVSALYYLVKPLVKEKFLQVLDRFFSGIVSLKTLTVKVGRTEETIYIKDILYVESSNHKCIIHTNSGDITANMSMTELANALLPYDFIKPVRYALVALREIANVPTDKLILNNGIVLSISRNERENVKKAYTDYHWKTMFNAKNN